MSLRKDVLKIGRKFTGGEPCTSVIKITLCHGCSPVNLLHIFRTSLDGCFFNLEMVFSNAFSTSIIDLHIFFKKKKFFSQHIMTDGLILEEESRIKDKRNLFRLKKN